MAGLSRWLAARAEVEVLCADERRPLFYRGGAPGALRGRGWVGAARFSSTLWLEAAKRARRWDALVSHWLVPSGAVGLSLQRGRPHLAIAHGSDVALLARLPGGRALVRSIARRADLVYVAGALRVDGAPGRVVPMGIDVAPLTPRPGERERERARLGLDGVVALYLGRLSTEKGCDRAIDALPDGLTLLVAGDGPERRELEARARGRRVRLVGEVRGEAERALLAAADLMVVPSRADGAPTVALEALAAGLPLVATSVGGLPELVRDGVTGLLCAPTVNGLHHALARLRDDAGLRRLLAARARAEAARHDWSVVGPTLAAQLVHGAVGAGAARLQVARI